MKRTLLVSFLVVFGLSTAFARVVRLAPCGSCPDDSPNIQQAIAVATANGTTPGTVILDGNFEIQTSIRIAVPNLTLQAAMPGATLHFVEDAGNVIELRGGADGFTVRGLTIRGFRGILFRGIQNSYGPVNNVSILNNTFATYFRGVAQWATTPASTGWTITGNRFVCPDEICVPDFGIVLALLLCGSSSTIADNVISYQGYSSDLGYSQGIWIQNPLDAPDAASGWSVKGNTIDAQLAMAIIGGSSNTVAKNASTIAGIDGLSINRAIFTDANGIPTGEYGRSVENNKISNNQFTNKSDVAVYLAAGTNDNNVIGNTISSTDAGVGIDLGDDGFQVGLPPATGNQINANEISGGAIGIRLRVLTARNVVTGNKISRTNPPEEGIVQDDPNSTNIVRGNPGFNPTTGRNKSNAFSMRHKTMQP